MVELAVEGGRLGVGGVGVSRGARVGVGREFGSEAVGGVSGTDSGVGVGVVRMGSGTTSGWPAEVSIRLISTEKSEG